MFILHLLAHPEMCHRALQMRISEVDRQDSCQIQHIYLLEKEAGS